MTDEKNMDETFIIDEPIEELKSNVIEKGRYKFKITDISGYISQNSNKCAKVGLKLENGSHITRSLLQEGKMKFLWNNLLFTIGIRNKTPGAEVSKKRIVCAEDGDWQGYVDIGVKKRTLDDGSTIEENSIVNFAPIDKPTAPISDVPAEPEKTKPKKEEKKKEEDDENVDDL